MERYLNQLATAFIRARLHHALATLEDGQRAGLRLRKFKMDVPLPRVQHVLGILPGLSPQRLLHVGSGRSAFLRPLLAACPQLTVIASDRNQPRLSDLAARRFVIWAQQAGAPRLAIEHLLNHRIALLRVQP